MVTWSGWALLEAIGRIVAGPEPLAAHGPEQPLVSGCSVVCFSGLSSHPKQGHRVSSACPFVIPSRWKIYFLLERFFSPPSCLSDYPSFCVTDTHVGSRQLRQRYVSLVIS